MSKNILEYNFIQQLQMLPFVDEIWLFGSRSRNDNLKNYYNSINAIYKKIKDK